MLYQQEVKCNAIWGFYCDRNHTPSSNGGCLLWLIKSKWRSPWVGLTPQLRVALLYSIMETFFSLFNYIKSDSSHHSGSVAKQESVEATATKQGQPASQANWSNGGNLVWKTRKTSQPTLDTAPYCSNSFVRQQRSLQKWNLVWKNRKTAQPTIHTAPYCSNSFVRLQRSIQKWLQWSAEITAISACATAHEDLTLFQGQRSRELDLMITYRK